MKKNYFLVLAALMLLVAPVTKAQVFDVKQVFVGSGGNYSDPDDFVEIGTYNPLDGQTAIMGSIKTQSIQDMLVDGIFVYVAAQDSIAKFNADSYERLAIVSAPGVNKLAIYEDKLLATFAYPVTENYLKVYRASNLEFLSAIADISDEAAGMLVVDTELYVAVPGGWASTVGKIALIDLTEMLFLKEVAMGTEAAGIFNLYMYDGQIVSVNKSAWGATTGYLSKVNTSLSQFDHTSFENALGAGVGLLNNALYVQMDGGIGEVNLDNMALVNSSVVEPLDMTIAAAVLDTVNSLFYVTTTDYASVGAGLIYNMAGENMASFDAGISAEALTIDYRISSGVNSLLAKVGIEVYPNPVTNFCHVSLPDQLQDAQYSLVDMQGRELLSGHTTSGDQLALDLTDLKTGMYVLSLQNEVAVGTVKLLVN